MKVIAISNQKGGVGKTTTTVNVASYVSQKKRVLVIDIDPQANTSCAVGIKAHKLDEKETVFGLLKSESKATAVIQRTKLGFDIIPSSINLSMANLVLAGYLSRESLLKEAIKHLDYDVVFIDCPPSLDLLAINAFTASDTVYVPVTPDEMAIWGLDLLFNTVGRMRENLNPHLSIGGMVITLYEKNLNIVKESLDDLEENYSHIMLDTKIRKNTSLREAVKIHKSIFQHKPDSSGAEDYKALAKEIIEREAL